MAWAVLFDLWAPILGALALGGAIEAGPRRDAALASYVRAALLVHALAIVTALAVRDVALPLLAGLDVALLAVVASSLVDERRLARARAHIEDADSFELGACEASQWLDELTRRAASPSTLADHALALAHSLEGAGHPDRADAVLAKVPETGLGGADLTRLSTARGLLALERGERTAARAHLARALEGRARPRGTWHIARAAWALLEAVEGRYAEAIARAGEVRSEDPRARAMIALALAHMHSALGDDRAALDVAAAGQEHARPVQRAPAQGGARRGAHR